MTRWRIDLGYDGAGFSGWARQQDLRTVQEELEDALEILMRRPVRLTVAGRTDAGVHALGQVATFDAEPESMERLGGPRGLVGSLNALTRPDVAVWSIAGAPDDFDARRSALARTYVYRLDTGRPPSPFERGRALWWPRRTEQALLEACAEAIVGSHDFTAFTPTKTKHVHFRRTVFIARWELEDAGRILSFRIEADAFMRSMVRILVGTMLEVATRQRTLDEFISLLDGAPRSAAGVTAPAHGLYLEQVRYGGAAT